MLKGLSMKLEMKLSCYQVFDIDEYLGYDQYRSSIISEYRVKYVTVYSQSEN